MSNNVKYFRNLKKVTQEELAKEVGISRTYLSYVETNKQNPTIEISLRIAKALGEKVDKIFFISNVNHGEQSSAWNLINIIPKLTKSHCQL